MKTMSDFIMEQEVNTAAVDNDLEIMEGFMKLSAVGAVAETYCEHAAIAAFAEENGLNVFSESAGDIVNKAWEGTKKFFNTIWEWLKSVVNGIIRFFTKSSVDRLIVKLRELSDKGKINTKAQGDEDVYLEVLTGITPAALDVDGIFKLVNDFSDVIKKGSEGANSEVIKGFIDQAENFLKKDTVKEKYKRDDTKSALLDDVLEVLERMSKADIPSKGRKLLKQLDFDKNNYKKGGDGDDKDKIDKDLVKSIKKAANLVAKAYDTYVDNTVKLVNKVLRKNIDKPDIAELNKQRKADYDQLEKEKNKNESYVENSDGYFFL